MMCDTRSLDDAQAEKALNSITKGQITEIKALGKPPDNVKMTLSAVMVMLGEKPVKVPGEKLGTKVNDHYLLTTF